MALICVRGTRECDGCGDCWGQAALDDPALDYLDNAWAIDSAYDNWEPLD